jgi:hypothetical protein
MSVLTVSLWEVIVGSINIPLNEIPERVEGLKKIESTFGTMLRLWKQKRDNCTSFQNLESSVIMVVLGWAISIINHKQQNKMINTLKKLFGLGPKGRLR